MSRGIPPDAPAYPRGLGDLEPPPTLDLRGAPVPEGPRVAIVGSRRASPDAESFTRRLARTLAARGATIVSGGAFGIDAAAHEGALSASRPTWCVLAGDVACPQPRAHRALFDAVLAGGGGLLAESERSASRAELVRRNRLVAALADILILVQGTARSGTRHTLRYAEKLGRPVGAVPWPPWDPRGAIPREALASGAFVVLDAGSVASRAGLEPAAPAEPGIDTPPIEAALAAGPLDLDGLARALGRSAAELGQLRVELGRMELEGRVRRRAGRYALE